jgi:hypothetical protein
MVAKLHEERMSKHNGKRNIYYVYIRCECSVEKWVRETDFNAGKIDSCGCQRLGNRNAETHGRKGTKLYTQWQDMLYRVRHDPNYIAVKVAPMFLTFEPFAAYVEQELGPCPPEFSLDRRNNDGNYEPGNLRWADRFTQAQNRRCARMLTAYGVTKNMSEWARDLGCGPTTILFRLKRGWSEERAVTVPVGSTRRKRAV